jgi:hypothetical protein
MKSKHSHRIYIHKKNKRNFCIIIPLIQGAIFKTMYFKVSSNCNVNNP